MSRSSIFSFDTLRVRREVPRGLLCALAMLLAIEVGLARRNWVWALVPRSQTGFVDVIERRIIASAPDPVIVLLGSSRVRDAVAPRELEKELGLPEGRVLNLGIILGTPYDSLVLYRRNRARLSKARLLIVGVEDWQFNAGFPPNDRMRRFATLRERLGVFDWERTSALVVGWAWRTFDARTPLLNLAKSLVRKTKEYSPVAEDGRIWWGPIQDKETGPDQCSVEVNVSMHYQRYAPSDGALEHLERLIALAREDSARVMLLQAPFRDAYMDQVRARWGEAYERYRRQVSNLPGADVQLFEKGSDVGIPANHFYDYGHLAVRGAQTMTRRLAQVLAARYPELVGARPESAPKAADAGVAIRNGSASAP